MLKDRIEAVAVLLILVAWFGAIGLMGTAIGGAIRQLLESC
jgi:hypothetical protein